MDLIQYGILLGTGGINIYKISMYITIYMLTATTNNMNVN